MKMDGMIKEVIGLIFIWIAMSMNRLLITEYNALDKKISTKLLKWIRIAKMLFMLDIIIFVTIIHRFISS